MKFKSIIYSATLAAVLLAGGCKKEKFDINSNPDDVTDVSVTPTVILPGALQATSALVAVDWDFLQMWMGYWARSGSYQSLTEIETYKFTNDFQSQVWYNLYSNANNYNLMITKAQANGSGTYEAIGRIMKAHNFQILVDVYNNVPYFEAFKGTSAATPKYDKGADIYKDLFKQLDTAVALLNDDAATAAALNPEIASADLVYKGDVTAWKRFANTLRLRMIVHLHNGANSTQVVPGFDIAEQVGKVTAEGFIGAGQSAHLNPGFVATKPNPFYRAYVTNEAGTTSQRDHIRANEYALEYYRYNGDPRINRFFVSPSGTTAGQKGITFGTPSGDEDLIGSNLSTVRAPGYLPSGATSRAWILTSVESLFLQAEAVERGVIPGTAKDLLTEAIRESFVWLGLTAAQADAYITGNAGYPDVDYDEAGGGLFTILSQKWFALNGIAAYEVWTDYRRTDYVLGVPVGFDPGPPISVDPANTSTKIPVRLLYPQNEFNYNAANVAAEGTVNVFTSKIFWDLN